jgi:hypothetical protein
MKFIWVLGILLVLSSEGWAFRPFILHSGKGQVTLLQYFRPDGCTSCDSQDKFFSDLRSDRKLWKKYVPVLLSQTQYKDIYSKLTPPSAATPSPAPEGAATPPPETVSEEGVFFLNGAKWVFKDGAVPMDKSVDVGNLEVARAKYDDFEITFIPKERNSNYVVTAALLASGEKDFTAVDLVSKPLKKVGDSYTVHVKLQMKKNPAGSKKNSAVFWITKEDDTKPVQAVGSDLKID